MVAGIEQLITKRDAPLNALASSPHERETPNPELGTARQDDARLHCVFGPLVLGLTDALFYCRIGNCDDSNSNENENAWKHQPLRPVRGRGNPQVIFCDLSQRESQYKGRPRPAEFEHKVAGEAENQSYNDIEKVIVRRKRADKNEEQQKGNQQRASDEG